MPAYKNKENGSWYVSAYYKNWKGEQTRKVKRGFSTKHDALEWERNFLSQHSDNLDMSFENFSILMMKITLIILRRLIPLIS